MENRLSVKVWQNQGVIAILSANWPNEKYVLFQGFSLEVALSVIGDSIFTTALYLFIKIRGTLQF